jgi:CO/xanthine dehydrogenase FAD-binding subunit
MLVGTGLEDNALAAAADAGAAESDPPADIDGSVAYKRKVIRDYVRRALERARAR